MQKWRETLQEKVKDFKGPKDAKNYMELLEWCKYKGYKTSYAWVLNQNLKLGLKVGGK